MSERRRLQCRVSGQVSLVHARFVLTQQKIDYLDVALGRGSVQRCRAVDVLSVHFGAVLEQKLGDLHIRKYFDFER